MPRRALYPLGVLAVVVAVAAGAAASTGASTRATAAVPSLRSPAFRAGGTIPVEYTCNGAGRRPALAWAGLPSGTRSVAIEVVDPDAPAPGGFTHWLAWNIPPGKGGAGTLAGTAKVAREGAPGFGPPGWVGPCPPSGVHRYVFTLYALKAPLGLAAGANRAAFERAVRGVLAKATLIGRYGRSST